MYGETGFKDGGQFKPHKTHRNGLSVDFMVPVRNGDGKSVPLPTSPLNKFGYNIEFDSQSKFGEYTIDYEALSLHLYQLDLAAKREGIKIWRVIFDPELQPHLHDQGNWGHLKQNMEFSTKRSWVRHDEHYHVDFVVACE